MKTLFLLPIVLFAGCAFADVLPATFTKQASGVAGRLRGVSAVDDNVAWASGADNAVLRTADGGATWRSLTPPVDAQATPLDFRDIDAIDTRTAYLLSIGPSTASRIFKTTDAGATWTQQYVNPDEKGFLDAMTFWDADNGMVIGDSIDGRLQILRTGDGGATWNKIPAAALPAALPNEGAFSASGSNIAMAGRDHAWIATGSRVLHTGDRGKTWSVVQAPLDSGESAGIFSITFRDALHGVIVGGDYKREGAAVNNVAVTSDGGKTWSLVREKGLSGYRSAVKYLPGGGKSLVAVGPSGADVSRDDGKTWTPLPYPASVAGFDAISFAAGRKTAWASGNKGELARVNFD
ncbi:WD40/YVTN/BNR-like repeat-containing protein [Burkholderia sp. LMU1-1-1.1]|uniref:WD40/YVTN/BNR-like repeat-containing protein n=1 Tax=Burkholderia sp. LMU1-1-1.1 TaxID=3135266 RepID=UPI00341E78D7